VHPFHLVGAAIREMEAFQRERRPGAVADEAFE